jgi:hypothetical protein
MKVTAVWGVPETKFSQIVLVRARMAISQVGAIERGIRPPNHHSGRPLDEPTSPCSTWDESEAEGNDWLTCCGGRRECPPGNRHDDSRTSFSPVRVKSAKHSGKPLDGVEQLKVVFRFDNSHPIFLWQE